ncbi:MAG: hypothetical protein QNJ54_01680 [Prochloraceae cyanobacterium]|nr:hypothetical protein [Prochloraceae cyanobacterium]
MTNSKSNGHKKKYDPSVEYDYFDADVWRKKEGEEEDVAYTNEIEELLDQLSEDEESSDDEEES